MSEEAQYYQTFLTVAAVMAAMLSPLIFILGCLILKAEEKVLQEIKVLENEHDY